MLPSLFHRIMLYYMLYVMRKFKNVTIDLNQYIYILIDLNFIFESLFVTEHFPSMYPALIRNILILSNRGRKKSILKQTITRPCFNDFIQLST